MLTKDFKCKRIYDLEKYSKDGRLTEPAGGERFQWRKMIDLSEKLGRALTKNEVETFRIK